MLRIRLAILALFISAVPALAQAALTFTAPHDAAMCLTAASGELLVGYASGRIARCDPKTKVCSDRVKTPGGGVLAMLPVRDSLIAATSTGQVLCYRAKSAKPAWEFTSTCEVSCLAEFGDLDKDGQSEIVAGGADHRVHMLNGKTGKPVWSHLFESQEGGDYIIRVLVTSDYDADGTPEVASWMWSGDCAVLNGKSGDQIWRKKLNAGYVDACTLIPDFNGDSSDDLLTGGNDGVIRLSSGRDGAELWTARLHGPVRTVVTRDRVAYACTAGGEVACFDITDREGKARWRFNVGDVCRDLLVSEHDGSLEVAVCAENGIVTILSATDGKPLRVWQSPQELRTLAALRPEFVAAASVDGTVGLVPLAPQQSPATWPARIKINTDKPAIAQKQVLRASEGQSKNPRVLILLYHDIVPEVFYHYGNSVKNFSAHMDLLKREHYTCVSLDQIADWIEGKAGIPDRAVCITFDGPYQGHYTYAYPTLREHGFFATSYITTDWIGQANHADWHQLREMDAAGIMSIQNHTTNHATLSRSPKDEVVRQLAGCNDAIGRHMQGKTSRHHAYPSGAFNDQARAVLRELGFRTATTIIGRPVNRSDDLLLLPRYMLCTHTSLEQFHSWLTGTETASTRH